MGHEYHACTTESAETVIEALREVAVSISSATYCNDHECGVSFNYESSSENSNWGDDIEVSYISDQDRVYILNSICPDQEFVDELTSLLKANGIALAFEEL